MVLELLSYHKQYVTQQNAIICNNLKTLEETNTTHLTKCVLI